MTFYRSLREKDSSSAKISFNHQDDGKIFATMHRFTNMLPMHSLEGSLKREHYQTTKQSEQRPPVKTRKMKRRGICDE